MHAITQYDRITARQLAYARTSDEEMYELAKAVQQMGPRFELTDNALINWKRSRGLWSARAMVSPHHQERFCSIARRYLRITRVLR